MTTTSQTHIRKAVFPVAGMGTRFLPATKAMPKEFPPIIDKPIIQYAGEEAALKVGGKQDHLEMVRDIVPREVE